MRIDAIAAGIGEGVEATVPPITLRIDPGAPVVVAVETDERPKLLSLLLGGRTKPTTGAIEIDGRADATALRRRVAVVDTPFGSEPSPLVPLRVAIAEELAFAGRPAGRRAVARVLEDHGLADRAHAPVDLLPPADRIRLLCELALLRAGVDALVVTSPERHGGDPRAWYPALAAIAERGTAVAVITDAPTAAVLRDLGARDAAEPAPADTTTDPEAPEEERS